MLTLEKPLPQSIGHPQMPDEYDAAHEIFVCAYRRAYIPPATPPRPESSVHVVSANARCHERGTATSWDSDESPIKS